jgi:hypothetical protein
LHIPRFRPAAPVLAAVAFLALAAPAAAQQTDVIRGRVTGPDSLPILNAQIAVTSVSGNVRRTATTNSDGRFTITFPGGDGDYMVSVTALGFAPRRFQLKRIADEEILIADARLARVEVLDEVTIVGQRERVRRTEPEPDISGTDRPIDAESAVPAADLGDLAAMAATLPGVDLVPGGDGDPNGFSVLGLGADQNATMLNGMPFGGSSLPRDASVATSVATSPYDVSRGGFSGGQLSIRTRPGSNFRIRGASLNLESPQAQWTDRAAEALGQQYSNMSLGGLVSGPLVPDKAFYSMAYQLGRRASDLQSLLHTSAVGLRTAGVSADSAARFLDLLRAAQIPTSIAGLSGDRVNEQGSLFGSFDFTPPSSSSGHAFNTSFNASWNRQNPAGGTATDVPAFAGERTSWRSGIQARHSGYIFGALSETSLGWSASRTDADPYLALPAGRVRVNSTFEEGASALQVLGFGGNQGLNSTQTSSDLAFLNQLSWFSTNNKHRVKLAGELRREAASQTQAGNLLGSFTYNSLADLEANTPASYSRQLSPRVRDASQVTAALSLGDSWRRTRSFQLQYGVRVDANNYLTRPRLNQEVESVFGLRNDRLPERVYLSPRAGFSWTYGTAAEVAGFAGAQRPPRGVVRGGIGMFQNIPGVNLIAGSLDNTGLADGARQLTCIGEATPVPDWTAWLENPDLVPDRCADGSAGTVFADAGPAVTFFSDDYRAPRSLRSNLQWSGPILDSRLSFQVEGTWSRNLNQSGFVDLNFDPSVHFVLDDEGGRPVFVQPSSIVPGTGAIATRDARVSPLFSRVMQLRSDLTSESRQMSLRLSPGRFNPNFGWSLSYVLSDVSEELRGFASTSGNPLDIQRARGSFGSRHRIVYNANYNLFDWVRLNWYGSLRSGSRFTPMVAGDMNGDGYSNDRAFVFDPATTADPAIAEGMQALLANGSGAARDCLRRQLGSVAVRNSCEGPWSSSAVLSLTLNPVKFRMPRRATVSFQLSNPLGAADLLLHGSDGLRGWGQNPFPDQSLLYVRGFDPQTQRYRYDVNQRFGATDPALTGFRTPVTLTAMMRFDLGPTRERQMLAQQLDRGRRTEGSRMPEPLLRAMLGSGGGLMNPMAVILRQQDSLRLSSAQADSIATLNRWYVVRLDSLWAPVATYLASLPDRYNEEEAWRRYLNTRRATVDLLTQLAPDVRGILTGEQLRKLPAMVTSYLEPRYLASIRSGTATFAAGGMIPPGGGVRTIDAHIMPAGGGGVMIIRQ